VIFEKSEGFCRKQWAVGMIQGLEFIMRLWRHVAWEAPDFPEILSLDRYEKNDEGYKHRGKENSSGSTQAEQRAKFGPTIVMRALKPQCWELQFRGQQTVSALGIFPPPPSCGTLPSCFPPSPLPPPGSPPPPVL